MVQETKSSIALDKSGKKFNCPQCGQKRFVRLKDEVTGEYLADHVGRCDRENNCGYHFTAKQYFVSTGTAYTPQPMIVKPAEVEKVDFMPASYIEKSMEGFEQSNFARYLIDLFTKEVASKALLQYFVGRSRHKPTYCIFWRIDKEEKVRTGKIMAYDPATGKRRQDIFPSWVHSQLKPFDFKLCFFGEHLLNEHPTKTVGIVESEKTAVIASIYYPDMVWLATGGKNGCKWREWSVFNVLKDRTIILFPDLGYSDKKTGKTCYQAWSEQAQAIQERMSCKIMVSRILEDNLLEDDREEDRDLADKLIKRDPQTGIAVTDEGYPVIWDLNNHLSK